MCARRPVLRLAGSVAPDDGLLEPHAQLLGRLVAAKSDITLDEPREALGTRSVTVSRATVQGMVKRLGLTLKKSLRASEQDRADVAAHGKCWRVWQRYIDAGSFVFLDGEADQPSPQRT